MGNWKLGREILEVIYRAPYSPLSVFSLFQDVAKRYLNDSFVTRLFLELPELVPNQESVEIAKPQRPRQT